MKYTIEEWRDHLWDSYIDLRERSVRDAESGGFGEDAVEEAERVINGMTNIELIHALV